MSYSERPDRWQPTRLPRPWDSPGKNTGVGCHFLLQRVKVKCESEVTQSCPTPSDPVDCSLPGSSVHGICQARVLEWVAIAYFHLNWCPNPNVKCHDYSHLTFSKPLGANVVTFLKKLAFSGDPEQQKPKDASLWLWLIPAPQGLPTLSFPRSPACWGSPKAPSTEAH